MAIDFKEINLFEIFQDLKKICRPSRVCTECKQYNCLVKYGQFCANKCAVESVTYVEQGKEHMPRPDMNGCYDEQEILHSIGHLLVQCKSCKEEHFDNCIISVLRNCLEQILFGESLPYEGFPLRYMVELSQRNREKTNVIKEEFKKKKEEA